MSMMTGDRAALLGRFVQTYMRVLDARTPTIEIPPEGSPERVVRRVAFEIFTIAVEELKPGEHTVQQLASTCFALAEAVNAATRAAITERRPRPPLHLVSEEGL